MYNIKMVSQLVDIPAVTIRAWERRYQVLHPKRTESGHRIYSDQDIEDLKWLKQQTEEMGLNISQAMRLLKKKNEQHVESSIDDSYRRWTNQLYDAVFLLHMDKAHAVLDLCFASLPYELVFHYIFKPLLRKVEEEIARGMIPTAVGKLVDHLLMERISAYWRMFAVLPNLPRALLLCPEEEYDQNGLLLFHLFLLRRGVDVLYLGPNILIQELIPLVEASGIQLIGLSLTRHHLTDKTLALLKQMNNSHPSLQIALEGQAFRGLSEEWSPHYIGDTIEAWEKWWIKARN